MATKAQLKALVGGIVAAQGNVFIRELLRDKGLAVSGTKEQFVARLEEAVEAGDLTLEDVELWLGRVEGWGNFHIYPRRISEGLAESRRWRPAEVRHRLANVPEDVWDAPTSQQFPEELTLTHASFQEKTLRLSWHQGSSWRQRAKGHDRAEEIDGDRFELDAYLVRAERTVVRFRASPREGIAALFVPYRLQDGHQEALTTVWDTLAGLMTRDDLPAFDLSGIIRAADQAQLDGTGQLRSKSALLTVQDGWVEFGSSAGPYGDIDQLREVRLAAGPESFTGGRATFFYAPPEDPSRRDVTVTVSGPQSRVWLPAQLQELQVWALVSALAQFEE